LNKTILIIWGVFLIFAGGGCMNSQLTPTPPVPVFGDFVLNVATTGLSENGSLQLQSLATDPTVAVNAKQVSLANGGIVVEETRNTISEISFNIEGEGSDEVDFPGAFVVELVQGGAIVNREFPDFGVTQLLFGEYREYEFRLVRLESEDIPEDLLEDPLVSSLLLDQSFLVTGRFMESAENDIDGNGEVNFINFQIISDNEVKIRVSSPNAFEVSSDKINFFFIAIKLEAWFNDLLPQLQNLESADLVQGVAVISDDHPSDQVRAILDHFESNTEISAQSAPSDDEEFDESDVDEDSGSSESGG
jgi:hypothetical protein